MTEIEQLQLILVERFSRWDEEIAKLTKLAEANLQMLKGKLVTNKDDKDEQDPPEEPK